MRLMNICRKSLPLLITCLFCSAHCLFDPLSLSVVGLGIGAFYGYGTLKDNVYCRFTECCNSQYIRTSLPGLEHSLKNSLFGQHIVLQHLLPALKMHLKPDARSRKPLVLSFHGTSGTGKNMVAELIVNSLYTNGLKSTFVRKYMGRQDFPMQSRKDQYKITLYNDIKETIESCPHTLFIFDEVNHMPEGVLESIASFLDYNHLGKSHNQAIFIFLSNTGGFHISNMLGKLMEDGKMREETKLRDFEQILEYAAYNLAGGLRESSVVESHGIDHYLPFLPLEKSHLENCVIAEWRRLSFSPPTPEEIDAVIKDNVVYDPDFNIFGTSGCKTFEKKVAVAVYDKYH